MLVTFPNPPLAYVGLSDNEIGAAGAAAIAAALASSTVLKQLDLAGVNADDRTAHILGFALAKPGVVLEQLVLQKNKITDVGGAKLAQGIAKRAVQWGEQNAEESSLKELDLKNNYVGDQTAFALAKVLTDEPNNMLQKLRLDVNPGITDRAAKRLADMLAVNVALTELDVEHTSITCWGWGKLDVGLNTHHVNHIPVYAETVQATSDAEAAVEVGKAEVATAEAYLAALEVELTSATVEYDTDPRDKNDVDRKELFAKMVTLRRQTSDSATSVVRLTKKLAQLKEAVLAAVAASVAFPPLAMLPDPGVELTYPECASLDAKSTSTTTTTVSTTTYTATTTTTSVSTTTYTTTTTTATTTTLTTTTTTPPAVDASLTTGEIGGISVGSLAIVGIFVAVFLIHHRTSHLPKKGSRMSWEDPNAGRIKRYGSDEDLAFDSADELRSSSKLGGPQRMSTESAGAYGLGASSGGGNSSSRRNTGGGYGAGAAAAAAGAARPAPAPGTGYAKGEVFDRGVRDQFAEPLRGQRSSEESLVDFPSGPGRGAGTTTGYVPMTAQSRGTRQPDDTYQFKMNTVDSMDIPAPTRTSFLPDAGAGVYGVGSVGNNTNTNTNESVAQPAMSMDAPGMYGVGSVPDLGAGNYGVGAVAPSRSSVASVGSATHMPSMAASEATMASSEAMLHQVVQRMNTLERENAKLRRSVRASMKLSMVTAKNTIGAGVVGLGAGRRSSVRNSAAAAAALAAAPPAAPTGTIVFDGRVTLPAGASLQGGVPIEEDTYSRVDKKRVPSLRPKASPADGSATAEQLGSIVQNAGGDTTADAAVQLPGTMSAEGGGDGSGGGSNRPSSSSVISVDRLNPGLSSAAAAGRVSMGSGIAAPLADADVLNPTRGSVDSLKRSSRGSKSIRLGTRRTSRSSSVHVGRGRRSGGSGGSMVVPTRSSLSTASSRESSGGAVGRVSSSNVKEAWASGGEVNGLTAL